MVFENCGSLCNSGVGLHRVHRAVASEKSTEAFACGFGASA
jgi:hypothetical protein